MGADLGLDEHQLRMENARLREEVYLPLFLIITLNKYLFRFTF